MSKFLAGFGSLLLAVWTSGAAFAQKPAAASGTHSSMVSAVLQQTIDAQKAKPGQLVEFKTSDDIKADPKTALPKGSKLTGHIVQVRAKSDADPTSQLIIAFDRAENPQGQSVPFFASIASIARPLSSVPPSDASGADTGLPSPSTSSPPTTARGNGQMSGAPAAGATQSRRNDNSASQGQPEAHGEFTLQPRGNGTIISSNSENVRLNSGTQVTLQIKPQR